MRSWIVIVIIAAFAAAGCHFPSAYGQSEKFDQMHRMQPGPNGPQGPCPMCQMGGIRPPMPHLELSMPSMGLCQDCQQAMKGVCPRCGKGGPEFDQCPMQKGPKWPGQMGPKGQGQGMPGMENQDNMRQKVKEYIKANHPDLFEKLSEIRENNPEKFQRLVQEALDNIDKPGKPGKQGGDKMGKPFANVDDDTRAKVRQYIKDNYPDIAENIGEFKEKRPEAFKRIVEEALADIDKPGKKGHKGDDMNKPGKPGKHGEGMGPGPGMPGPGGPEGGPGMMGGKGGPKFEESPRAKELRKEIKELAENYKEAGPKKKDGIKADVEKKLNEMFDERDKEALVGIEEMEKQIKEIKNFREKHIKERAELIKKRLAEILGE